MKKSPMVYFNVLHLEISIRRQFLLLVLCFCANPFWVFGQVNINVIIQNESSINTKTLEYSPTFYKDNLVFTSTRPTAGSPMTKWRDEKEQFSDLYVADRSNYGGFFNARRLSGKANGRTHDGVATFNNTGTVMYFTRSNMNGKNVDNVINLKIYATELINNVWQNVQELPFNDEHFSNCHPSLSKDGMVLYFASDRPGGFGGMDIYKSEKINGVWQQPQNLGAKVNSEYNEFFPFITPLGTLYFASDNPIGFGGLDLYKSYNTGKESFEQRENLGAAFNSAADDFGFCTNAQEDFGYFSSNRRGGKGGDDIYRWQIEKIELPPDQLSLTIYDAHSNMRVSGAQVTIFNDSINATNHDVYPIAKMVRLNANNPYAQLEEKRFQTGRKGEISMVVAPNESYTIFIEKEGYLPLKKVVSAEELKQKKQWELAFSPKAGIPLVVKAIEVPSRLEVPFVELELHSLCTNEIQRAISDQNGQFSFYLACGCDYELVGKKDAFRDYKKKFSISYRNCGNINTIKTELYMVEQEMIETIVVSDNLRYNSFESFEAQNTHRVGQIVLLDQLDFPDNKAVLSPEAVAEINKVHYFLQRHPEVSVEISAHTDARGTAKFNHKLSQKRADAIANFLLNKGIPKEQISAVGYGEDKLLNHCQDGIRCSEYETAQNKRVEMKITKIRQFNAENLLGQR